MYRNNIEIIRNYNVLMVKFNKKNNNLIKKQTNRNTRIK